MEAPPNTNMYIADLPQGIDAGTVQNIFSEYGTIVQGRLKVLAGNGRKSAAMITFQSIDEAKWIKENLDGNIPQGLSEPIIVKYADTPEIKAAKAMGQNYMGQGMNGFQNGKGYGKAKNAMVPPRSMPYNMNMNMNNMMAPAMIGGPSPGAMKGKFSPKGCGKGGIMPGNMMPGIKGLINQLMESQALPGSAEMDNDKNALYVSGLPPDTQDVDLYKMFAPFGAIAPKGVRAMLHPDGSCQGWGFVNYMDPMSVQAASDLLNGTQQGDGRELIVKPKEAKKAAAS
ncbi:unnamed protein product [Durusdinium trenchii]|uniref:Uncharacterized protein n=2 Tax=Durusdinium trenchii TaxID=1381693 RepID=A0ABP0S4D8_9DINO